MPNLFGLFLFLAMLLFIFEQSSTSKEPDPPDPKGFRTLSVADYDEIKCLRNNLYFEARGEGYWGMLAVGAVTLNRVEKRRMSICTVVYEPFQFSWTHELSDAAQRRRVKQDPEAWALAMEIATDLYLNPHNKHKAGIGGRDHFYNPQKVERIYHGRNLPRWITKGKAHLKIGNHTFIYV